jgi:hypothetical protein
MKYADWRCIAPEEDRFLMRPGGDNQTGRLYTAVMTPAQQTIAALIIVALAAGWLFWRALSGRGAGGCGSDECRAISPELKKLQRRLKR